ncbi:beta-ketoacyl synthase chain length factor [Chitinophaga rhizophila]|uniref:Beta-ketoacyl synthase chain length factor n=1 Tax=Chitinophaga rhizophila TaxID=2866212 RepID=A0ABS7GFA5_9BACT|nr:beta-ketoacyl synthase chain length factor [Chitinophaga rhizophila]MBW8685352.1 beta-ketoacyl synthase chain length factor [Chitinophaga rhizophila]
MAAISPQHTFDGDLLTQPMIVTQGNRLSCVEPDYRAFIAPNSLRRMTRVLKMGLAASLKCLQDGGIHVPGAIVTGTGKGSLQDTERFIKEIRDFEERALNPTPFIQSTYNAVNGLIALQQKCTQYNNTFVHRGFSFEHALLDSLLLLSEGTPNVLAGAFDEITPEHFFIKGRIGHWKRETISNDQLYAHVSPGTISGEGAAFFLLTNTPGEQTYAQIGGLQLLYKPTPAHLGTALSQFLAQRNMQPEDIDLILTGANADSNHLHYYQLLDSYPQRTQLPFKHLCGDYETAGAFALWLAATILKEQQIPKAWFPMVTHQPERLKNVLIYNHFFGEQHVFMLLHSKD